MSGVLDYLIIGGGITGVTMARLLQMAGIDRVRVLEASHEPGGLCRTAHVNGHVLDTGGGHFLCTRYPAVYDFVFTHLPKTEFNYFDRVSKIAIGTHEVDYPLESNVWQLPVDEQIEFLISVVRNGEARGLPPPLDFEAWCRWKLGDRITDAYMLPYNRKIWGVDPSEMDVDWLHKIPRLDVGQVVRACLNRHADTQQMPSHAGFYYPKQGGFQEVFDSILRPVAGLVEAGTPVEKIERSSDGLLHVGRYRTRHVINTAPWHALADSPVFDRPTREAISRLRHNAIVVSLHQEPVDTPAHWRYEPDESLAHHRSFFIHNFAPHSRSDGVYRETNARRWNDAAAHAIHSTHNAYAYPIPTVGWAADARRVLAPAPHLTSTAWAGGASGATSTPTSASMRRCLWPTGSAKVSGVKGSSIDVGGDSNVFASRDVMRSTGVAITASSRFD